MSSTVTRIRHGRIELALHVRSAPAGPPLLLLHALGESAASALGAVEWTGPVHALDFAGHGASDWLRGGGYTAEGFAADADCVLAHLGEGAAPVCVAGFGLGAYVALLLAGARPDAVGAAMLVPGAGLGEGSGEPDFAHPARRWAPLEPAEAWGGADPALARLHDFKPRDYVRSFADRARALLLVEPGPVSGASAAPRPGWWRIVAETPGTELVGPDLAEALAALARHHDASHRGTAGTRSAGPDSTGRHR